MRLLPAWGTGLLGSWWIARLQRSPEGWARAAECPARILPVAGIRLGTPRRTFSGSVALLMPREPSPAGHSPPKVTLRGQAETRCSFSPSKTPRQANRPL